MLGIQLSWYSFKDDKWRVLLYKKNILSNPKNIVFLIFRIP